MGKLTLCLIFTLIVLSTTFLMNGTIAIIEAQPTIEYLPVSMVDYRPIYKGTPKVIHAGGVQVCDKCNCCVSNNSSNCQVMPCCYGINCNIPGKPFGTCAFQPKACNCDSCVNSS